MVLDDYVIQYNICDTAGQERFHFLAHGFLRGTHIALIVYSVNDEVRISLLQCCLYCLVVVSWGFLDEISLLRLFYECDRMFCYSRFFFLYVHLLLVVLATINDFQTLKCSCSCVHKIIGTLSIMYYYCRWRQLHVQCQ